MNIYQLVGKKVVAKNEYLAVYKVFKMADRIEMVSYEGNETWIYRAIFKSGAETITVKRALNP